MQTSSDLLYYLRIVFLSAILLGLLSACASTPPTSAVQKQPVVPQVQPVPTNSPAATPKRPTQTATAPKASNFREDIKTFFGPKLNVQLRQ